MGALLGLLLGRGGAPTCRVHEMSRGRTSTQCALWRATFLLLDDARLIVGCRHCELVPVVVGDR